MATRINKTKSKLDPRVSSLLSPRDLQRIANGTYEDVFSALGLHEAADGDGWVIRVCLLYTSDAADD